MLLFVGMCVFGRRVECIATVWHHFRALRRVEVAYPSCIHDPGPAISSERTSLQLPKAMRFGNNLFTGMSKACLATAQSGFAMVHGGVVSKQCKIQK